MGPADRHLKQDITYWAPGAPDGYGSRAFTAPVTIKGRWEERSVQFHMNDGELVVSNAVVFVGQEVELDGYLYLGSSNTANPMSVEGAFVIRQYTEFPDLRNMTKERKAYL